MNMIGNQDRLLMIKEKAIHSEKTYGCNSLG